MLFNSIIFFSFIPFLIMIKKIPSLEKSSKKRLLFVCKNLQNLAKYHETKIANLEMKVERLEKENTELRNLPLSHIDFL